jgi:coenzyme Q-binding protein COQ10
MPHYETERHVAHSAGDMFSLVGDVERYPEFVPFCERLVVRARRQDGSAEVIVADMTVGYRAIRETFTTRVVLDRSSLVVSAQYLEGPFRHLDSRWLLTPDGPGKCKIHFSID